MDERSLRRRAATLAAVVVLAVAGTAAASTRALGSRAHDPALANGFAGPVAAAPRALDRDVETSPAHALRRVPCAGGLPTTACWISTSTRG